ncbi:hypothetical protein FRC17_003504, partial [Serendipita sp. 399]
RVKVGLLSSTIFVPELTFIHLDRTEISPGKVGPISTLRSGTQDNTALAYLDKRSFTAPRGLQQLIRRHGSSTPLEIHTAGELHHNRERTYHKTEEDCHLSAAIKAKAHGDASKQAKHTRKFNYHYWKAQSHEDQRDIHRLHLNSLSNPQNAQDNNRMAEQLSLRAATRESLAAGYAPEPGEESLKCEA